MNETSTTRLKLALSVLGLGFPFFLLKQMKNQGFCPRNGVHFGVPFGVLLGVRFGVHFGVHFGSILGVEEKRREENSRREKKRREENSRREE